MVDLKKALFAGVVLSSALILSACNLYKAPSGETDQSQEQTQANEVPIPGANVVTYSDSGFSPNPITFKVGEKVEFKNNSSANVQVNSAVHPTHQLYPELNIGVIAPNETKTVTFTKAGTYKYHNHLNASQTGEIVVE